MKPRIAAALTGLFLLAGPTLATADTVVIKPEQEVVIKEYVAKKPLASIDLPGIDINIGTALPDTVELHAVEVPDVNYRYTVVGDRTVLVDPDSRKIVHIIN